MGQEFEIKDGILVKYRGEGGDVTIPDSVIAIGENAFKDCSELKSVVIPDSVTSIGSGAFKDCYNLERVILPNRLTAIGSFAFMRCYNLMCILIPNSVTSMGDSVFFRCRQIAIYCQAESKPDNWWDSWDFCGSISDDWGNPDAQEYCYVEWGYRGDAEQACIDSQKQLEELERESMKDGADGVSLEEFLRILGFKGDK